MSRKDWTLLIVSVCLAPLALLIQFVFLGGIKDPDLNLILACAAGWLAPWPTSGLLGFAVGLIQDLFAGRVLGFSALALTVASMSMSWMRRLLNPGMLFSAGLAGSASVMISDFLAFALLRLLKMPLQFELFLKKMLPFTVGWAFMLTGLFSFIVGKASNIALKLWPDSATERAGKISYGPKL